MPAVSSACSMSLAVASASSDSQPVARRPIMARNPTTNSGTIGALPAASAPGCVLAAAPQPDTGDERRQQDDPGELDQRRRRQRRLGVGRRRGRDLADVVHAGAGPGAELLDAEPEGVADRREHGDREAAAQRDQPDGVGDLLLVGVGQRLHRRDGRRAADRVPGGHEQPEARVARPSTGPAAARRRTSSRRRRRR